MASIYYCGACAIGAQTFPRVAVKATCRCNAVIGMSLKLFHIDTKNKTQKF